MEKLYKKASREYKKENTIVEVPNGKGQIIRIGGQRLVSIAGPSIIESREQMLQTAEAVAFSGASLLRGDAYKSRTSPYSFQGLGEEGLKYLKEAGEKFALPVVSEIIDSEFIPVMKDYVDVFQIGARNMQNFELLKKVGALGLPVILKRGLSATIDDFLMAAEYLLASGTEKVILCERGIRTFESATRNTLDLSAIPVLRSLTHLPVIVDPSHAIGLRDKIPPMALASVAGGADGLLLDVHCDPEKAESDGTQSLYPQQFDKLMHDIEALAPVIGKSITHIREEVHLEKKNKNEEVKTSGITCGFCGNRGTYAEQAIKRYFDTETVAAVPEKSFAEVFQNVTDGKLDFGIIPIENSLAGSVYDNYDNFSRFEDVSIVGSVTLNIRHSLLAVKGTKLSDIKNVYSHPQALSQCKLFLNQHNQWKQIESISTATAAEFVASQNSKENAAIGSKINSELYNLVILCDDVEDDPGNYTRFVVICANNAEPKIKLCNVLPKTASLIFKTKNKSGALYHCLGIIDKYKLNLSRLESRPIRGEPWRYWFYTDADISNLDEKLRNKEYIQKAANELLDLAEDVRILGVY